MKSKSLIAYLMLGLLIVGTGIFSQPNTVSATSCSSAGPDNDTIYATSGSRRTYAYGVSGDVTMVYFPTWTDVGGQNDIIWYSSTNAGGGTWYVDINLASHPDIGYINVHVYMHVGGVNTWCDTAGFNRATPIVSNPLNIATGCVEDAEVSLSSTLP